MHATPQSKFKDVSGEEDFEIMFLITFQDPISLCFFSSYRNKKIVGRE
jgi:hypothetical protein